MVSPRLKRSGALTCVFLFIGLHAGFNIAFPRLSEPISFVFFLMASAVAFAVCCRRAITSGSGVRRSWILICTGLLLWLAGTVVAETSEIYQHFEAQTATASDFLYFFYGVPVLLAFSSSQESRQIPLFFWLDGMQAAVAGYLAYIAIFSVLPFSGLPQQPIPVSLLAWTYDVENLVLAAGATVRLLASPSDAEERRLLRTLVIFLWTYAGCVFIYNHITAVLGDAGIFDVLADIPFAALTMAAIYLPVKPNGPVQSVRRKQLALFIGIARPVMFAMALVVLSAAVAMRHFYTGMASIVFALAVYGLRSTVLQSRYMRSQEALEEAKNRLEEMTLIDSLTSIANRRCFDQRLEQEWSRADRAQTPLSLLLIDIDYFKNLNDTYGHQAGDECLAKVAVALRQTLIRGADLLARYGGEEFAALLPETDSDGANAVALRMQAAVHTLNIGNQTAVGPCISISIGLATCEVPRYASPAMLIDTSDRALYQAKQNGRNRIEMLPMQESRKPATIN